MVVAKSPVVSKQCVMRGEAAQEIPWALSLVQKASLSEQDDPVVKTVLHSI